MDDPNFNSSDIDQAFFHSSLLQNSQFDSFGSQSHGSANFIYRGSSDSALGYTLSQGFSVESSLLNDGISFPGLQLSENLQGRNIGSDSLFHSIGSESFQNELSAWDTSSDPIHNPMPQLEREPLEALEKGLMVSIQRCSTSHDNDSSGNAVIFHVLVSTQIASYEIVKDYSHFKSLSRNLSRSLHNVRLPILPAPVDFGMPLHQAAEESRLRLEKYLQEIICIREVWMNLFLIEFLDMSNFSLKLENRALGVVVGDLMTKLQKARSQLDLVSNHVFKMQSKITELERQMHNNNNNNNLSLSSMLSQQQAYGGSSSSVVSGGRVTPPISSSLQYNQNILKKPSPATRSSFMNPELMQSQSQQSDLSPQLAQLSFREQDHKHYQRQMFGNQFGSEAQELMNDSMLSTSMTAETDFTFSARPHSPPPLPDPIAVQQTFFIDRNSIPTNETSSYDDIAVRNVIALIQPNDTAIAYRTTLTLFLARVVRKTLNAKIFDLNPVALRCFVPDDPVRISLIICRAQELTWHSRLNEKLLSPTLMEDTKDDTMSETEVELEEPLPVFPVSGVIMTTSDVSQGLHRIQCQIANITYDIVTNNKQELLLLAFLEDVDALVGANHLFKRSLVLIRGWWIYESRAYVSGGTAEYLSDNAISVLVCAIFNRFHKMIFSPFQAFCYFLSEYAGLDWTTCAVTLQGLVPLTNGRYEAVAAAADDLLKPEIMRKYADIPANLEDGESATTVTVGTAGTTDNVSGGSNSYASGNVGGSTGTLFMNYHGASSNRGSGGNIEKQHMNIIFPFDNDQNMVTGNLTPEKYAGVVLFMQESAKMVQFAIDHSAANSTSALMDYFRIIVSTFSDGWRPDVPLDDAMDGRQSSEQTASDVTYEDKYRVEDPFLDPNLVPSYSNPSSTSNNDGDEYSDESFYRMGVDPPSKLPGIFWDRVRYCQLLLEGRVTEIALRTLCSDIIADRGPLPVGEVGKMLQEMTSMSAFSVALKEKFGGLKKFLEKFSKVFMICIDHPFNPHVFLKSSLTPTEQSQILSGVGTVLDIVLYKLKKKSNKKKKSFTTTSLTELVSGLPPTSPSLSGSSMPLTLSSLTGTNPSFLNLAMQSAAAASGSSSGSSGGGGGGGAYGSVGGSSGMLGRRPGVPGAASSIALSSVSSSSRPTGGPAPGLTRPMAGRGDSGLALGKATFPGASAMRPGMGVGGPVNMFPGATGPGGGGGGAGAAPSPMLHYGTLPTKRGSAGLLQARQRQMLAVWQQQQFKQQQQQPQQSSQHHRMLSSPEPSGLSTPPTMHSQIALQQQILNQQQQQQQLQQQQQQQQQQQRSYSLTDGSAMGGAAPDPRAPAFYPKGHNNNIR